MFFPVFGGVKLRKIIIICVLLLLFSSVGAVSLLAMLVEDVARVQEIIKPTTQSLKLAKQTVKAINGELKEPGGNKVIEINQAQLTAIFALISDIFKNISVRHNSDGGSLLVSASIELPKNPFGRFININTYISNDYTNSEIDRTTIGSISISNRVCVALLSRIVEWRAGDEFIKPDGDWVDDISVVQDTLVIRFNPELNTAELLANLKSKGRQTLDAIVPVGKFYGVQLYYDHLLTTTRLMLDSKIPVSQFEYLKLVLEKAGQKSNNTNAQDENIYALLALGLLVGDYELKRAINSVVHVKNLSERSHNVILANRHDLNLHFIYSVILTILSNQGVTVSIGEIKEVSDSGKGGSGFSFVDLAADRAGIRFAEFATGNQVTAKLVQNNILQLNSESGMFPDTEFLQEGLSEEQFKKSYRDRESADYKSVIDEIDRRIAGLAIYRQ